MSKLVFQRQNKGFAFWRKLALKVYGRQIHQNIHMLAAYSMLCTLAFPAFEDTQQLYNATSLPGSLFTRSKMSVDYFLLFLWCMIYVACFLICGFNVMEFRYTLVDWVRVLWGILYFRTWEPWGVVFIPFSNHRQGF